MGSCVHIENFRCFQRNLHRKTTLNRVIKLKIRHGNPNFSKSIRTVSPDFLQSINPLRKFLLDPLDPIVSGLYHFS